MVKCDGHVVLGVGGNHPMQSLRYEDVLNLDIQTFFLYFYKGLCKNYTILALCSIASI